MSLDYAWQNFHKAVLSLVGAPDQRTRLVNALCYCLAFIKPEDLPEEYRHEFKTMMEELSSKDAKGDEGTYAATVASLTDLQVSGYVEKIVSMYDATAQDLGKT